MALVNKYTFWGLFSSCKYDSQLPNRPYLSCTHPPPPPPIGIPIQELLVEEHPQKSRGSVPSAEEGGPGLSVRERGSGDPVWWGMRGMTTAPLRKCNWQLGSQSEIAMFVGCWATHSCHSLLSRCCLRRRGYPFGRHCRGCLNRLKLKITAITGETASLACIRTRGGLAHGQQHH